MLVTSIGCCIICVDSEDPAGVVLACTSGCSNSGSFSSAPVSLRARRRPEVSLTTLENPYPVLGSTTTRCRRASMGPPQRTTRRRRGSGTNTRRRRLIGPSRRSERGIKRNGRVGETRACSPELFGRKAAVLNQEVSGDFHAESGTRSKIRKCSGA